jgi:hypothetical protein
VKKLNKNHLEAARLRFEGETNQQIADACDVSLRTVENWSSMPLFLAELERLEAEQRDRYRDIAGAETVLALSEIEAVAAFQAKVRSETHDFYELVHTKIVEAVETLAPETLPRWLPSLVKSRRDLVETLLSTDAETLGLEDLAAMVDGK